MDDNFSTSSTQWLTALKGVPAHTTATVTPLLLSLQANAVGSYNVILEGLKKRDNKVVGVVVSAVGLSAFTYIVCKSKDRTRTGVKHVSITSVDQMLMLAGTPGIFVSVKDFFSAPVVDSVHIEGAQLSAVPSRVVALRNLKTLDLSNNCITSIPSAIGNLNGLIALNLSKNRITALPSTLKGLDKLEDLDVSSNELCALPSEIGDLTSLKYLNAMKNEIILLPEEIGNLKRLKRLGLKGNRLKALPPTIGNLSALVELFLTDNELVQLPNEVANLKALVKLQASFNALTFLPTELGHLPQLELLRVACCDISEQPLGLSHAPKLSWVSIAGNPCCHKPSPRRAPSIPFEDIITMKEKLGDGASGEVFAGEWQGRRVAVKIFPPSEVGPDGHARDEIAIATAASDRNLVQILGVCQSPLALISELAVDSTGNSLKPLAEKPNHVSLLRCRWPDDVVYSLTFILNVATCVASGLAALHAKGICHGDVYAHNILTDSEATKVMLCDYGAAFFYKTGKNMPPYEAIEVRSYGLLLQDMLQRLSVDFEGMERTLESQKQMLILAQVCLNIQSAKRPKFSEIVRQLKSMQKAAGKAGLTPRNDSSPNTAR